MLTKGQAIGALICLLVWADGAYGLSGWFLVAAIGIVGWRFMLPAQPTPSIAQPPPSVYTNSDLNSWRLWEPNGPLSELGVAEIERRFTAGEDNGTIAREMQITPKGVADRRAMWSGSHSTPSTVQAANDPWRKRPGGPLSELGVAEIERRFAAGEDNETIAQEMRIASEGVASRRAMWSGNSR